jgi:hypothetical protein
LKYNVARKGKRRSTDNAIDIRRREPETCGERSNETRDPDDENRGRRVEGSVSPGGRNGVANRTRQEAERDNSTDQTWHITGSRVQGWGQIVQPLGQAPPVDGAQVPLSQTHSPGLQQLAILLYFAQHVPFGQHFADELKFPQMNPPHA